MESSMGVGVENKVSLGACQGALRVPTWLRDSQHHGHSLRQACPCVTTLSIELESLGESPGRKVTFNTSSALELLSQGPHISLFPCFFISSLTSIPGGFEKEEQ